MSSDAGRAPPSQSSHSPPVPVQPAPRVLLVGTGSIGAVYAYLLSRAIGPSNLFTVCRSNYDVAATQGFTIHSVRFGQNLRVHPQVVRTVDEAVDKSHGRPFDYILVTAKATMSTPPLAELLRAAVSPSSTIALIQNGIAIEEPYATRYPNNPLLSCVVYLPATETERGTIVHDGGEDLLVGPYPSSSPVRAAEQLAALIRSGGGAAEVRADVQRERWSKLLVNAAWNPVCALSRCRDAQFLHSSPSAVDLVQNVMLEVASIAQAAGYPDIDASTVQRQLSRAQARPLPGVEPSMLADARTGRAMEVDAIVGNAIRIAQEKDVSTPLLCAVYAMLQGLNASFRFEVPAETK